MKKQREAARRRWARQAAVWRRPSQPVPTALVRERPWAFWVVAVVLHGVALSAIPRVEAAGRQVKPAPIVVERVVRNPPSATPDPIPSPAPAPPLKRTAAVRRARTAETPAAPASAAPKKLVGLSLSATAPGAGPAYRVGETVRGTTEVGPGPEASAPTPAATGAGGVARVIALELPRRLRPIEPLYPEEYRGHRIEGQVTIALRIDADGSVGGVEVITPSPHPGFNRSAVATAKRERFSPATQNGVPIPHTIRCTYHFKLSS